MILESIVAFAAAAIVSMLFIIWRELHIIGFMIYQATTQEKDNETEGSDAG
jgi:hypothetical protein